MSDLATKTMQRVTSGGFSAHTSPWDHKVAVMLYAAQGIIDNGGFRYFFASPFVDRPDMDEFVKVFEAVGAERSAQAMREALCRSASPQPDFSDLDAVLWGESEKNYGLLEIYIREHERSYA